MNSSDEKMLHKRRDEKEAKKFKIVLNSVSPLLH